MPELSENRDNVALPGASLCSSSVADCNEYVWPSVRKSAASDCDPETMSVAPEAFARLSVSTEAALEGKTAALKYSKPSMTNELLGGVMTSCKLILSQDALGRKEERIPHSRAEYCVCVVLSRPGSCKADVSKAVDFVSRM
jgi:hypothetical protein